MIRKVITKALEDTIRSSRIVERIQARRLASTSKRLDICAAQFAHILHQSNNPSLSQKVCLEIGSGWVLSHALVCHLLGAARVIATDLFPHAHPKSLQISVHKAIASVVRDVLSPFEEHALLRSRLDNLLSISNFDFDTLKNLGIEYIAPIDFAKSRLETSVDFIFSNSVLEHVPCKEVPLLLRNIVTDLKPGGTMIHCIHLEDHKDIASNPFEFLSSSLNEYPDCLQSSRGNRIRQSGWQEMFSMLEGTDSELIYEWARNDQDIPVHIERSIHYKDNADLRVSHIGVYSRKR